MTDSRHVVECGVICVLVSLSQLALILIVFALIVQIYAEKPQKDIYNFIGTYSRTDGIDQHESLSVENMIWSNTVVASGLVEDVAMSLELPMAMQ